MIYTLTLNPSLDYTAFLGQFRPGMVNRTKKEAIYPGGKGLNVSIVLNRLGIETCALGFLAGFTGEEIRRCLQKLGCQEDMIFLEEGYSRINVKIRGEEESELNGSGPNISDQALKALYRQLDRLTPKDALVMAGSIPSSVPKTIYSDIMERLQEKKIPVIVDAAGELLASVLSYHPFLIKPNHHELGELFGKRLEGKEEIALYAGKLQQMGARNVLVSMAGEGAFLAAEDGNTYESPAPKGVLVNSVGAGDSMVAGFLAGYTKSGSFSEAFFTGIAAGSATAFSPWLTDREKTEAILTQMGVL